MLDKDFFMKRVDSYVRKDTFFNFEAIKNLFMHI